MIRRTQGERRESQLSLKAIASTWEFAAICITLSRKQPHGHHLVPFNQPWLDYDHERHAMWCIHKTILEGPCKGSKPGRSFHGRILKTPKENGRAHPGSYVCRINLESISQASDYWPEKKKFWPIRNRSPVLIIGFGIQ